MQTSPPSILDRLRETLATLTPAERRVAELILSRPHAVLSWSITEMSKLAEASDPSVIRFCRRMGCNGFPALKLELAQALAAVQQTPRRRAPAAGSDPVAEIMHDVLERSENALRDAHADMDPAAVGRAADIIARARRVDIYGFGVSGFLALEAQYRLSLLGLTAVAQADPVIQGSMAPLLGKNDVVFAISFSGLTHYLSEAISLAKSSGVQIVSLSPTGSPVAGLADVNITLNGYRKSDNFLASPPARLGMHMALDILCHAIVDRLGTEPETR